MYRTARGEIARLQLCNLAVIYLPDSDIYYQGSRLLSTRVARRHLRKPTWIGEPVMWRRIWDLHPCARIIPNGRFLRAARRNRRHPNKLIREVLRGVVG